MSRYVQVGMTAVRDPMTGEVTNSVPLYVDEDDMGIIKIPPIDMQALAKEIGAKFRALKDSKKDR